MTGSDGKEMTVASQRIRGGAWMSLAAWLFWVGCANAASPPPKLGWWGVFVPVGGPLFDNSSADKPRERPPLKGEYAKRYADTLAMVHRGQKIADGASRCLPAGVPRVNFEQRPLEIVVTPKQTVIIHEFNREPRWIRTDGSPRPEDPDITFNGSSVGKWEGGTLVVDTVALREDAGIDQLTPHSERLHVIERIRLRDPNTLENAITVEDQLALTHPWKTVRVYKRRPDVRIQQSDCEEQLSASGPGA